jgi:hypothetical protein
LLFVLLFSISCKTPKELQLPFKARPDTLDGSAFYRLAEHFDWRQRDSMAVAEILEGNLPAFLTRFCRVEVTMLDSTTGKQIKAYYYVSPDYLGVGNHGDWARVPLTPMAAQAIADSLGCFLPTRKMVNDIYLAAAVKLAPKPLLKARDSSTSMWLHHQLIETERAGRGGLIAGIKKDIVITTKLKQSSTPKVAIYGWHKADGQPIQPLYTGHSAKYVDYSHGARLVYRKIRVDGKLMDYTEVLTHPVFSRLLCDEVACDYFRYPGR